MPFLTDQQLANVAAAAGWTGYDLVTAVAVALAESRGDSDARGDVALQTSTWGPSIGLWQIRSLKAERGKGTTRDELANVHPVVNGFHAHAIWLQAGRSFRPWSTFVNQSYRLYLSRAAAAARTASGSGAGRAPTHEDPDVTAARIGIKIGAGVISGGAAIAEGAEAIGGAVPSVVDVAGDALRIVARAGAWVTNPANVTRVLLVILGGGMVLAGAAIAARPAVDTAANVAKAVRP